jgi:hypothetical protein
MPFCHVGQVNFDMDVMIEVVFLIGKGMDHLTSHLDWWMMNHLINQNFAQIKINYFVL